MRTIVKTAPDGGWGWLIVLASSVIIFTTKAIAQTFGLLFGDLLKQLEIETVGASAVTATMDGIFNFSGLIVGPLVKKYTYRQVAIVGALMSSAALMLAGFANSFLHILITFGVLGGIGFSLVNSCTLVGINDYFSEKKGQAIGLSMTGIGAGFILMPQIVRFFLDEYDCRSAILLMGAISLHALVGACLFQPVSWHKKSQIIEVEEEANTLLPSDKVEKKDSSALIGTIDGARRNVSSSNLNNIPLKTFMRKDSLISNSSLVNEAENSFYIKVAAVKESGKKLEKHPKKTIENSVKSVLLKLSEKLDLNLLRDGVYLNIICGMSLCLVVEMNFKYTLPFYLSDLEFKRSDIAYALSSMGISDICARILVPLIVAKIAIPWRAVFLCGVVGVGVGQSCFILQTTIGSMMVIILIIGVFQGMTLTSYPLILADFSSGNNFPSVLGLSMVVKGIFIVVLVPVSGYVRDVTQSYIFYFCFNIALLIMIFITWSAEFFIIKYKHNKQAIIDALRKENEEIIIVTEA